MAKKLIFDDYSNKESSKEKESKKSRSSSRSPDSRHRRRRSRSRSRDRRRGSRDRRRSSRERDRESSRKSESGKSSKEKDNQKYEADLEKELEKERRRREDEAKREESRRKAEIEDLTKDQRTMFVGQLVAKVKEDDLRDYFSQVGKVKSIIMVRDKYTNKHKGFAYVEMEDLDTIPTCLLFHDKIPSFQKYAIIVRPSEAEKNFVAKKDTTASASVPDTRVYVGNIHYSIDEAALKTIVEQFGPVASLTIHRDETGKSKGFAFVRYRDPEGAMMAMSGLGGLEILGCHLKVGPVFASGANGGLAPGGSQLSPSGNAASSWKLDDDEGGSKGMSFNSHSRLQLMAKLGEGAGIKVPTMSNPSMMMYGGAGIPGTATLPPISGAPSQYLLMANLFDNLQPPVDEPTWDEDIRQDVWDRCVQFGQVDQIVLMKNRPGGMVLVKLQSTDAAVKAAQDMHGKSYAGRQVVVTYLEPTAFASMLAVAH